MLFEHVERVADRASIFQDGGTGEGTSIDEFLDQFGRGAVIPAQLFAPLLRLLGQQWFELPGRQLSQIDNLHGTGTQPLARSVHSHFYHIYSSVRPYVLRKHLADRWSVARCHLCYHAIAKRNASRPQRIGRRGGSSL